MVLFKQSWYDDQDIGFILLLSVSVQNLRQVQGEREWYKRAAHGELVEPIAAMIVTD